MKWCQGPSELYELCVVMLETPECVKYFYASLLFETVLRPHVVMTLGLFVLVVRAP